MKNHAPLAAFAATMPMRIAIRYAKSHTGQGVIAAFLFNLCLGREYGVIVSKLAVIYKSKYGTTEKYAKWIAQALDAALLEASNVNPSQLESFDVVIYGGGLYAGGIDGIELVTKNPCKQLVVFTVGLANPGLTDYSAILDKNFTKELLSKTKVFHLRGGIDYKKLGLMHKGMMAMMRKLTAKKDKSELTEEDNEFLRTYGSEVDFTDKDTITPIINYVTSLGLMRNIQE